MLRQDEAPVCCLKGHTVLHQCRIQVCVGKLHTVVPALEMITQDVQLYFEFLYQAAGGVLIEVLVWVFTKTDLART